MDLGDQVKKYVNDIKESDSDSTDKANENLSKAIESLSNELVNAVENKTIKIYDMKDVRDLASIFTMLKQVNEDGTDKDAPAIPKQSSSYLSASLGLDSVRENSEIDASDKTESLTEEDVAKLINKQFDSTNKENEGE